MKPLMFLCPFILMPLCPFLAYAQLSIPVINDTVVVDFTGFTAAGFSPSPSAGQLSSNDWSIRGFDFDTLLDFGETQTTSDFARGASAGGVTTGGIYAFDIGGGNVALGVQPTGNDFTPGSFTLRVQNNTGVPVTDFEIEYTALYYNDQNRASTFNFSYSSDNSSYTAVPSLDITTPAPLDSPASWIATTNATLMTALNLQPGSYYYFRWSSADAGGSGSRDELALDDIKIIASGPTVFANFAANDVCDGDAVFFTDLSTTATGSITDWLWTFGDGDSATLQNPSHLYSASGTYAVTLTIITSSADTSSITQSVTVNPKPVAVFTASNFCQGSAVQFSDNSTIVSGSVASWSWNFGDSATSTLQNPTHVYSDTGNFTVTLTTTSDQGCMDSVSYSIIIEPGPIINDSGLAVTHSKCSANNGAISGISVIGTGTFTYIWEDSSGNAVGNTLDVTNLLPGDYFLFVSTVQCTGTFGPVTVNDLLPAPVVSLIASDTVICYGTPVTFTAIPAGYDYYEFFLDSFIVQWGLNNTFTSDLLSDGDYMTVIVSDSICAGQPSNTVVITVNPTPLTDFTSSVTGATVSFNNYSTGGTPPYTYTWDFGDGAGTSNLFSPTYSYSSTGSYYVCLTVEDAAGCSDMFCDSVDVTVGINENPVRQLHINIENDFVVISNPENILIEQVDIFNVAGEKVTQSVIPNGVSLPAGQAGNLTINISNQPGGIYLIRVSMGGDVFTKIAAKSH